jgi:peptide/nickel transport system permease protein
VLALFARRALTATATLALVTLLVFLLIHLAPGGPLQGSTEEEEGLQRTSPQAREALRTLYHLDLPLHRQYLLWLDDLVHGDLGRSFRDRRPVIDKIGERLGVTLLLEGLALGLMLLVAVPLGVLAALRPGSAWDRWAAGGTYLLHAVPSFWAGLLLQLALAVHLGWLPLAGLSGSDAPPLSSLAGWRDRAAHLVLPVLCLSYGGLAYLSRFVRATLIDSALAESWRAARARGLSRAAVVWRHGLRQAGVPLLTLAGFLLPGLVSGSVIVESIFAIPGIGRLFADAAYQRDVPVLMGLTLLSGTFVLLGVTLADMAYAWIDPRSRRGRA